MRRLVGRICISILLFYLSPAGASQHGPVPRSCWHSTCKIQCRFSWGCWSIASHRESQRYGPHECWVVYQYLLGLTPDKPNAPPPQDKPTPGISASHCRFPSPLFRLSSFWYQRDRRILSPVCLYWKRKKKWCKLISAQTRLNTRCMGLCTRRNHLRVYIYPNLLRKFPKIVEWGLSCRKCEDSLTIR